MQSRTLMQLEGLYCTEVVFRVASRCLAIWRHASGSMLAPRLLRNMTDILLHHESIIKDRKHEFTSNR